MKESIHDLWLGFEDMVIAKDAPEIQRQEMRLAFYAGFGACLGSMRKLTSDVPPVSDAEGIRAVEEWWTECDVFIEEQSRRGRIPDE
jgi:hypothetical protein